MEWDLKQWASWAIDSVKVTLSGQDTEYWAHDYDPIFKDMTLYLSEPTSAEAVYLASEAEAVTSSDTTLKDFGTAFAAGFGVTAAALGVATLIQRRKVQTEEDYQGV